MLSSGVEEMDVLTDTEIAVLEIISSEGSKKPLEIKDRVHVTKNHAYGIMKVLCDNGYLKREKHEEFYVYSLNIDPKLLLEKIEKARVRKAENAQMKMRIVFCPLCKKYSQQFLSEGNQPDSLCGYCKAEFKKDGRDLDEFISEFSLFNVKPFIRLPQKRLEELFFEHKRYRISHMRETMERKTSVAKKTHYQILKTIQEYNRRNEFIGFKKLCALKIMDFHIVTEFIRDAEGWGMITGNLCEDSIGVFRALTVTPVGDAFISYYENYIKQ